MLEKVRKELVECIEKYTLQDVRTINKSKELDKIIVIEQLKSINAKN